MRNITLMTLLLLLSSRVMAQINVSDVTVHKQETKALISFTAQINEKAVGRDYRLILIPVIYSAKHSQTLSPIIIESRRTRIIDRRNRLVHDPQVFYAENGNSVQYTTTVTYNSWFLGADLRLDKLLVGCCSEQNITASIVADNLQVSGMDQLMVHAGNIVLILEKNTSLPTNYMSDSSKDQPKMVKADLIDMNVDFARGSATLDLFMLDNHRLFEDLIIALRSSKDMLRDKIRITGYASPDGTQEGNFKLAQNRALAVRNYLLDNIPTLRPSNFEIISGGENWEGLYKLVEESRMPGRWRVLDIIENVPVEINYDSNTSRKKALMDLDGGNTWKYMYDYFFPLLRNAASVAVYKQAQEAESLSVTSSLFTAQNTVIINRAIELIGENKSSEALELLSAIDNDPRAWNPIGVCYVFKADMAKAKEYFQKAAYVGYKDSQTNLNQISMQ